MIRFCDREICCVTENGLDRQQILHYFLNGHRNDLICVLDEKGKFAGSITYRSLLGHELEDSISRDCMVLGEAIWEEGRRCFKRHSNSAGEVVYIPVVDKERNLLSFAYQDEEANRELRMLDELMEHPDALGFCDVHPECSKVIVHEMNELAYYFVLYLKCTGVSVGVEGNLWKSFSLWENIKGSEEEALDYKILHVYGEGTADIKVEDAQLRYSVSSEFECIDRIYEANMQTGLICDASTDINDLIRILQGKPVGILGADRFSIKAYDLLLGYGIDIACFVMDETGRRDWTLFGKRIRSRREAEREWENIIFLQSDAKYSAWGFGKTDLYHYLGYKRNQRFFLFQDYSDISKGSFWNVMKHMTDQAAGRVVLLGDIWLCRRLDRELKNSIPPECHKKVVYCDILEKYTKEEIGMGHICKGEFDQKDCCLLLLPEYWGCFIREKNSINYRQKIKNEIERELEKCRICSLTDLPLESMDFVETKHVLAENKKSDFQVAKIIIGTSNPCSGNIFFKDILHGHPDIIMIPDYNYLRNNLYSLCVRLAMEESTKILPLFWRLYEEESFMCKKVIFKKDVFEEFMSKFLAKKKRFTSQELFVILNLSYAGMRGMKVEDISKLAIYWEPHHVPREECENYAGWLDGICTEGYIVNVVRDAFIRSGSFFRSLENQNNTSVSFRMQEILKYPNAEKQDYPGWKRVVMKFEDLKCNPREEMQSFCEQTKVKWSDALLTIQDIWEDMDKGDVTGFNLTSVYRRWEEYFSAFDRLRILLIQGMWQKDYGYPYENCLDFSRRELLDLFAKRFCFEEKFAIENEEQKTAYLKWRKAYIGNCLWRVRREEIVRRSLEIS